MVEIVRTNDLVLVGFLQSLLENANIPVLVADAHMSALEGMIGVFPRRILVPGRSCGAGPPPDRRCRARRRIACMPEVTEDLLLGGRVRLRQPAKGHRAGTDAVLLAASAPVRPGDVVMDVGAATGAVGLMVAERQQDARFVFVERDPALAELCRRNCRRQRCDGRGRRCRRARQGFAPGGRAAARERRSRPHQPALPGRGAGADLAGQGPGGGPCPAGRRPRSRG